jgi:predicted GNAT family N-acyltransferase
MTDYGIRLAVWAFDEPKLRMLRHTVFVLEQGVPERIEWDGIDKDCSHAIAEDSAGNVIGCGRLLPDGHIGRLSVLPDWRGRGVGTALLGRLIALATERGHGRVMANAQEHACSFYERNGFISVGDAFSEAGIVHRAMERAL